MKVLIAEADTALASVYQIQFEDAGFSVVGAADGEEALRKAKEERPDLILLNVLLPKKDGIAVLGELNKHPETANIPIILLTDLAGRLEDTQAAQALGAVDLIIKPLAAPQDIIAKVREVLGRKAE